LKGIAYVDERVVRKVHPGQDVRISSGVFNRLEFGNFYGKVDRIRDVPEELKGSSGSTKYPVEIVVDPEGRELKLGSSAEFAIVAGREPVIYALMGISKEDFKRPPRRSAGMANIKISKPPASDVVVTAPPAQDSREERDSRTY
jgi:hypothetical protein